MIIVIAGAILLKVFYEAPIVVSHYLIHKSESDADCHGQPCVTDKWNKTNLHAPVNRSRVIQVFLIKLQLYLQVVNLQNAVTIMTQALHEN